MRRLATILCVLALAGCSKAPDAREADETPPAAPGIVPTAAPGVAFAYAYTFRLPPAAIATTQEVHAQACEKLGVSRCRITGMRYRLVGENAVEGMLAFKLDPALARAFGKQGIVAVESAKGALVDAEITGTDAAAQIDRTSTERAATADDIARIDREIAKPGRSAAERAELQQQRATLVDRSRASETTVGDARDSLAATPMTYTYASGPTIRGFDTSAPLASALDTAIASAQITLGVVVGFAAIFGPPALVLFLLWFAWRRWLAALWRRARDAS